MSIQAAATVVALGIAFVLMAAIPVVLLWVFLATMRGEGVIEGPHVFEGPPQSPQPPDDEKEPPSS